MRRAAGAHVILGMDLEEADVSARLEHIVGMLGLEADADTGRERQPL